MKNNEDGQKRGKKILADYKKVGSTFIPPMLHRLGPLKYISWQTQILPELVWWDVVMDGVSPRFAANVAGEIAAYFKGKNAGEHWWSFASDYAQINPDVLGELKDHLRRANVLTPFLDSLSNFLNLYPECPLSSFSNESVLGAPNSEYLAHFEKRLEVLQNKRSRNGVLVQAQAIYMGFILGKMYVKQGLALAEFPEVEHYPATERSQQVGASICAAVNMVAGSSLPKYTEDTWVQYFWRRSLELRPLGFGYLIKR